MVNKDFPSFLGGVERDLEGRIVKAEAAIMFFFSKMNVTEAHLEQVQDESILGDQVIHGALTIKCKLDIMFFTTTQFWISTLCDK